MMKPPVAWCDQFIYKETQMPTLEQIQNRLKKIQARAEVLIAKRAQSVLNVIRALMEKHGLTMADIGAHAGTAKGGAKRGPKPGVKRSGKAAVAAPSERCPSSCALL